MFFGILQTFLSRDFSFNVDGVPLFKSINVQLLPILCSVKGFEPFVVALFCWPSKPNSLDNYLSDFLNDLYELKRNGVSYNEHFGYRFQHLFVMLQPDLSSFNGYYGCERCVIKGRWNNLITFHSDRMNTLRTDEKFQNFEYNDHQLNRSPLLEIRIEYIE